MNLSTSVRDVVSSRYVGPLNIVRGLDILEFKTLEDMCEPPGAYVNMESELPDGTIGKLPDDSRTYLCSQVPINETECYGVASDEKQIIINRCKIDVSENDVPRITFPRITFPRARWFKSLPCKRSCEERHNR